MKRSCGKKGGSGAGARLYLGGLPPGGVSLSFIQGPILIHSKREKKIRGRAQSKTMKVKEFLHLEEIVCSVKRISGSKKKKGV